MMKNPENKHLRIAWHSNSGEPWSMTHNDTVRASVLSNLAIAESNLVRAGKDSALPHFIAIVKELEDLCGFWFEIEE